MSNFTAEHIKLTNGQAIVVVKDIDGRSNCLVTFTGARCDQLAEALVSVVQKTICTECGGMAGNHQQIFVITDMDNGEVNGYNADCKKGTK